ncbi:MAG TPA: AtpZ/AtpI family protein [Ktedonobacterales bacterium]|jgi:F0F1-type ATP synthase assembly protein I
MKSDKPKRSRASDLAAFALVGQVGLTISISLLVGIGIGLFIDSKLHSSPIATLIGLLLGLAAGIYGVYRLISSLE